MTNLDQFESVFKSADKTQFELQPVELKSVLIMTDEGAERSDQIRAAVASMLGSLDPTPQFSVVTGDKFSTVEQVTQLLQNANPDLLCTYRNLHTPATEYPYSLGVYLDVITQVTHIPVLVIPHPLRNETYHLPSRLNNVMAITDHLTGEHRLVSYAGRMTASDGTLWLTHVEDEVTFERYIATIGKIPTIDTDEARSTILEQLLKEPQDFIHSCRDGLHDAGMPFRVEPLVAVGHHLKDYQRLIAEHQVDLLVLNTKDDDQLAMHGLAYPLTVELRDLPMVLL